MTIEQVKLSQVKVNANNPRTITKEKFNRLVDNILTLPKMLELRPIVHDGKMTALGGNQRRQALVAISKMTPEQIATRLASLDDYRRKTEGERKQLIEWWGKWLAKPFAYVIDASTLSEDERKQFIIKDNVSFGTWDYDALANSWDNQKLGDWGMDVWKTAPQAYQPMQPAATNQPARQDNPPAPSEDDDKVELERSTEDADEQERIVVVFPKTERKMFEETFGVNLDSPKRGITRSSLLIPCKKESNGVQVFKFNDLIRFKLTT